MAIVVLSETPNMTKEQFDKVSPSWAGRFAAEVCCQRAHTPRRTDGLDRGGT